ncbi:MAG: phosphoribosyltransferase [Lachnospiraceae bacterium]|nr:phosphoribosyltransferase [Lachnospiraceae bacterium]
MFEVNKTDRINELISITKSASGISGPELAMAHMELGKYLAQCFPEMTPEDTTVVAMHRGGIFFAEGIYFYLGCKFQMYDPKKDEFVRPETKNVIIVDSVINTGHTIKKILQPDMLIASCVVNEQAVKFFGDQLYTIRVSKNSFVGANINKQKGGVGPDTTMRLFNQI